MARTVRFQCRCRQRYKLTLEEYSNEANSPQGEYGATGCSGAGCTQRLEPAVRGPAEILAELKTFIKEEHESVDWLPTDSMYVVGARDAYDTVLQHIERLSGTEPQDAA